jgi:RNase P subunit RPR2
MGQINKNEYQDDEEPLLKETHEIQHELEQKLKPYLDRALIYSQKGDEKNFCICIDNAKKIAQELELANDQIKNIYNQFYNDRMNRYIEYVQKAAKNGDEELMTLYIKYAKGDAHKIIINNIKLGDTRSFLTNQMNKYIHYAYDFAKDGDEGSMIAYVKYAKQYANKLNINIDNQFNNIKLGDTTQFKTNRLNKNLKWAQECVQKGRLEDAEVYINISKTYANQLNVNIEPQIKQILNNI